MQNHPQNTVLIYHTDDGLTKINLYVQNGSVWLSQIQIAELFQNSKQNISKHIKAIFADGELDEKSTVNYQLTVQTEGKRNINRQIAYYNLDMILAIGYRVRSPRGIQFRHYASTVLKEYLLQGFALNDDKLKNLGDINPFKRLLERIRDIRSSEKVFYRQVLDLFATSTDYDKNTEQAKQFFATIQNKMHYATTHKTACELVYERVDGNKALMGMTVFKGKSPTLSEAKVAKNYLTEQELKGLNQLVSGYLDFAERQAEKKQPMTMQDWLNHIDKILKATGEDLLQGNGKISRSKMEAKVKQEFKHYHTQNLSQVEQDYLAEIKHLENLAKGKKYS